jgi:cell division protease FtsH
MIQKGPRNDPGGFSKLYSKFKGSNDRQDKRSNIPGSSGEPPMRKMHFSLLYFLLAMLAVIWLQGQVVDSQMQKIPYSEFKDLVAKGSVSDLTIETDRIRGTLSQESGPGQPFYTVRVDDPELIRLLDEKDIQYTGRVESRWLSLLMVWIAPLALLFVFWSFMLRRMGGGAQGVFSVGKARIKIHSEKDVRITFDDVAGIDEAKAELEEIVEFLRNPDKIKRLGGKIPKGVLLVGAPGTGKTLLARAVAGEAGVAFFSMSGSDFVEMFVGVGAARVRDLFSQAKENSPCIIFVDELDALGKARGINPMGSHDEREQTLNQLLSEMDGFDPRAGIIVLAATNRPEILDPALLRPGRFDRHVAVDKPDVRGREEILKIHVRNVKIAPEVDLKKVAAMTIGFVGADLANLVNEAALLAARRDKNYVTIAEFQDAIDRIVGGLEKRNRAMNPKEKEIVAYHESGHALVAMSVRHADPLNKISIVPRGIGALGYTQQLPVEDRYLMTRGELIDRLHVLLGGRVAEEIIFGDISTGAQNDLQRASDIARSMVIEYGMSDRLGPLTYSREQRSPFLDSGMESRTREYSERTAQEIDAEISNIIEDAHQRVRFILMEKSAYLRDLAQTLLEAEVLEGERLKDFVAAVRNGRNPFREAAAVARTM